jgi:hypothetical protein
MTDENPSGPPKLVEEKEEEPASEVGSQEQRVDNEDSGREILARLNQIETNQRNSAFLPIALFMGGIAVSMVIYASNQSDTILFVPIMAVAFFCIISMFWVMRKWKRFRE